MYVCMYVDPCVERHRDLDEFQGCFHSCPGCRCRQGSYDHLRFGFRVSGFGFRVSGLGFRVLRFRLLLHPAVCTSSKFGRGCWGGGCAVRSAIFFSFLHFTAGASPPAPGTGFASGVSLHAAKAAL